MTPGTNPYEQADEVRDPAEEIEAHYTEKLDALRAELANARQVIAYRDAEARETLRALLVGIDCGGFELRLAQERAREVLRKLGGGH